MNNKDKTLNIFFSWQSQVTENKNFIMESLGKARANILKKETTGNIIITDATRGEPGSPHIISAILNKILDCDVFVADITPISKSLIPGISNPNVCFELGYAIANLGWERIILLYNTEHGEIPKDVPFDFSGNRMTPFTTNNKNSLNQIVTLALEDIIKHIEAAPQTSLKNYPNTQKDENMLRWLLLSLHVPTVQEFITRMPSEFSYLALDAYDEFFYKVNNKLFYIYDEDIDNDIKKLIDAWSRALGPVGIFREDHAHKRYVLCNQSDEIETYLDEVTEARNNMNSALDSLLKNIRVKHPNIDLMEETPKAWQRLIDVQ
ncbi:Uncharacterised protein [Enterobacter hormaechei]|uniref:hypothetical protein n=1 Tax=Enterobacter hormaechei TaxID=158836 RepID=UPI000750FC12|nr:hypothetical protein [Enterobacter hormaechei]KUQ93877.1 hypothetical protein AWI31_04760 [Enterobacter hormaechei subsp. xiangfangensis]VAC10721.1 Uncharacterised protein [Enterobacter hormaechei]VAE04660.1 Uncharacterised protein [Enterobacter hormaechei]VAF66276.1 Uncharacterised protein [Enterobacter hormaechei]HEM8791264.1 hypothetical protein [Enterobacter hormaechei]